MSVLDPADCGTPRGGASGIGGGTRPVAACQTHWFSEDQPMTYDGGAAGTGVAGHRGLPDFLGGRRLLAEDSRTESGHARFRRRYPHPTPIGAWPIARWVAGRIGRVLLVVWLTATAVFFAVNVALNPVATMLPLGATQQTIDQFRQALGLNTPLVVRYFDFLWDILHLNIGPSLWLGRDAFGEAISHIPATLEIAIPASIIGTTIGSVFGILSGRRPDSAFARVVNVFSFVLISAAEFWVGVMAILIFAVWLRLLPAGGSNGISSAILPIAVLSLRPLAHATQVMSTSVAEEMQKDYVLTARAKGMSEQRSVLRHVARTPRCPRSRSPSSTSEPCSAESPSSSKRCSRGPGSDSWPPRPSKRMTWS